MRLARSLAAMLAACAILPAAFAQSTSFTYQGELSSGGVPANGPHDLRFRLFDAAFGGTQVGSPLCAENVAVTQGTFTTSLDFGAQFASAAGRFLEIEVRRDTGLNCGNTSGFTVLTPRQAITPTPRAMTASVAHALAAPDGSPANAVVVDNDGKVGVGVAAPQAALHVQGTIGGTSPGEGVRIQGDGAGVASVGYLSFYDNAGTAIGYVGDGSTTDSATYLTSYTSKVHIYTPIGPVLTASEAGNVGIGTTIPTAKLDVAGTIHTSNIFTGDGRVQRYKTIHGATFQPAIESGGDNPATIRYADGILGNTPSNGICTENYYYAPVELPDGAVITNVLFTYYDNGPCGTYGELYRLHLFNGQLNTMVTFPFDDFNGTTVKIVGSSNISLATVDNSTYAYVLRVHMNGFPRASGSYMRILGARIRYETNIPYP